MKTTVLTLSAIAFALTIFSCASANHMQAMQQELDRYHRLDSLAYDIITRNNVPDMDGGDEMAEYLELQNK